MMTLWKLNNKKPVLNGSPYCKDSVCCWSYWAI